MGEAVILRIRVPVSQTLYQDVPAENMLEISINDECDCGSKKDKLMVVVIVSRKNSSGSKNGNSNNH